MKVKVVFVFILLCLFSFNFCYSENSFFSKTHLYLYGISGIEVDANKEITLYTEKSDDESKIEFDGLKGGAKLYLPFCEIRFFERINKEQKDCNFGVSVFSDNLLKVFPVSIKYGNLKNGGSFSKLKNPLLSDSISAFGNNKTSVTNLTASLPGYSYYTDSKSIFAQYGYSNNKSVLRTIIFNAWNSPYEEITAGSVLFKIVPLRNFVLSFSATGGLFPYKENISNSWFTTTDYYYHSGNHYCGLLQSSFDVPHFKTLFSAYFFQSPFNKIEWLYKSENTIKTNNFTFNLAGLINYSPDIYTSSENHLKPCIQFKLGFQNKYSAVVKIPIFIKTGLSTYTNVNLTDSSQDYKLAGGIQIFALLTSLNIGGGITIKANPVNQLNSNTYETSITKYSLQIGNSWNLKQISPNINGTFTFSQKTKDSDFQISQKYGLSFLLGNKYRIIQDNSFSVTTQKQDSLSWKMNSSINTTLNFKYVTCLFKMSIVFFADS